MNKGMLVLEPSAPCHNEAQPLRHALDGIAGKVIGFIDNSKPNFDHLVDDLADVLVGAYGAAGVVKRRKRVAGMPVPDAVMKELREQCDAVITGSGD